MRGFDLLVLMRAYEMIRKRERLSELRCVVLFSFSAFAPTRCKLSMTDRDNLTRMFNYIANVNAQQVNNAGGKGSGNLIGNMSCTKRVINIT